MDLSASYMHARWGLTNILYSCRNPQDLSGDCFMLDPSQVIRMYTCRECTEVRLFPASTDWLHTVHTLEKSPGAVSCEQRCCKDQRLTLKLPSGVFLDPTTIAPEAIIGIPVIYCNRENLLQYFCFWGPQRPRWRWKCKFIFRVVWGLNGL